MVEVALKMEGVDLGDFDIAALITSWSRNRFPRRPSFTAG